MRLDKYIAACGNESRKDVKKLIKQGLVTVDGVVCARAEAQVNEESVVCVSGKELHYRKFVYLMMNKPSGYISAVFDKQYPVVTDLIGEEYSHFDVFPAGRLDIDTEGLIILTNDGQLAHEVTSPKKNVYKRYFARVDKPMDESDIEAFGHGMEFKEFTAKPAVLEITDDPREVYIEIAEGKFHQVKRMCERVGKTVTYLKRVKIGALCLDKTLGLGEVRELSTEELHLLQEYDNSH